MRQPSIVLEFVPNIGLVFITMSHVERKIRFERLSKAIWEYAKSCDLSLDHSCGFEQTIRCAGVFLTFAIVHDCSD
jgi:hypothetical protein